MATYNLMTGKLEGEIQKPIVENRHYALFGRSDDLDTSTLYCKCGASYTWAGAEGDPAAFILKHLPHVEKNSASAIIEG